MAPREARLTRHKQGPLAATQKNENIHQENIALFNYQFVGNWILENVDLDGQLRLEPKRKRIANARHCIDFDILLQDNFLVGNSEPRCIRSFSTEKKEF